MDERLRDLAARLVPHTAGAALVVVKGGVHYRIQRVVIVTTTAPRVELVAADTARRNGRPMHAVLVFATYESLLEAVIAGAAR